MTGERISRQCPFCGWPVQNESRFTWVHHRKTWRVVFGGKDAEGHGRIQYNEVDDPDYDRIMLDQLARLAAQYGLALVPRTQ